MSFTFRSCSYAELQMHISSGLYRLQAWKLITSDYMDGLEAVENSDGSVVALIYYDPERNENCEMLIMEFEVRFDLRRQGIGRAVIRQFLQHHQSSAELLPLGEDTVDFWKACGFVGDGFGLYYYPEETNEQLPCM